MRPQRSARASGFTLIEILVVLVIISIVISFAVLKLGVTGRDSAIDDETRRIQGLMGLLQERAVLEGRDFGLLVEPASYQFVVYQNRRQRWENFDEEREFRRRDLPKGVAFQLQMDSRNIVLKPRSKDIKSGEPLTAPQLVIAASGEGTPFKLTLVRDGTPNRGVVNADAFGKITLESPDKAAVRP
jgi:general secretion pathway protein H